MMPCASRHSAAARPLPTTVPPYCLLSRLTPCMGACQPSGFVVGDLVLITCSAAGINFWRLASVEACLLRSGVAFADLYRVRFEDATTTIVTGNNLRQVPLRPTESQSESESEGKRAR